MIKIILSFSSCASAISKHETHYNCHKGTWTVLEYIFPLLFLLVLDVSTFYFTYTANSLLSIKYWEIRCASCMRGTLTWVQYKIKSMHFAFLLGNSRPVDERYCNMNTDSINLYCNGTYMREDSQPMKIPDNQEFTVITEQNTHIHIQRMDLLLSSTVVWWPRIVLQTPTSKFSIWSYND
jgi:hypothetical protein